LAVEVFWLIVVGIAALVLGAGIAYKLVERKQEQKKERSWRSRYGP